MRTHGEIIQAQDAILAETQKWMKMAKMELNHKRETIKDREQTILNQGITISIQNQEIDALEEEINDLKNALLSYGTKIAELGLENGKLKLHKKFTDHVTIHIQGLE